jgi:hypothetical protein
MERKARAGKAQVCWLFKPGHLRNSDGRDHDQEMKTMPQEKTNSPWRALSVGRPTRAEKIGCCPGRPIAIYRLELAAFRFLHFAPWFLENQPAVLSLSV